MNVKARVLSVAAVAALVVMAAHPVFAQEEEDLAKKLANSAYCFLTRHWMMMHPSSGCSAQAAFCACPGCS